MLTPWHSFSNHLYPTRDWPPQRTIKTNWGVWCVARHIRTVYSHKGWLYWGVSQVWNVGNCGLRAPSECTRKTEKAPLSHDSVQAVKYQKKLDEMDPGWIQLQRYLSTVHGKKNVGQRSSIYAPVTIGRKIKTQIRQPNPATFRPGDQPPGQTRRTWWSQTLAGLWDSSELHCKSSLAVECSVAGSYLLDLVLFYVTLFYCFFFFLPVSLLGTNCTCVHLITPFLRHHLRHDRNSGDAWYHHREVCAGRRSTKAAVLLEWRTDQICSARYHSSSNWCIA